MFDKIIGGNDHIDLLEDDNQYYLKVKKLGYSMIQLNDFIKAYPRVRVTQFAALQGAFLSLDNKAVLLGEQKPLIELFLSKDKLIAHALINLNQDEFENIDKKALLTELIHLMNTEGIIFGYELSELIKELKPFDKFVVAKGTLPEKGADAKVRYYEVEEAKPEIYQNGDVNHYELNLINKVNKGEWVGERIEPKAGIPGKTVTGQMIPALKGHQEQLKYDKKSIIEVYDEDKDMTFLYADRLGAVVYENGIISVCNYLEIDGKVSFKTGNVDFDGYVDISDVVEDNFSVKANHDIQIKGDMGIGGVDQIESREGSIFIRGGIAGKGKAKIICEGDLYTKFAADCDIECGGSVHIGYYALNSNIKAKEVIFDSFDSKMMGGSINAKIRVVVGSVGSRSEIPTTIRIDGFKREAVKEEYEFIQETIVKVKEKIGVLGQKLTLLEMVAAGDKEKMNDLHKVKEELDYFKKNLQLLYAKQKKSISFLQAKGEGELKINHRMYPKVNISIGNHNFWNNEPYLSPITYYIEGSELKKVNL